MAYQVLARKWRPRTFGEVVGQRHITRSLENAICHKRLGHAYLLAGTRGVGKTSVARIFAKSLRCENPRKNGDYCGECTACEDSLRQTSLNIYELDGASHNKVEDVRDLIDGTRTLPTSGRYKVYIIDEVHMLSMAAFNALLKTLEDSPTHVIFILATTNPDKLPDTILSRCQRFDFKSASIGEMVSLMEKIADKEDIQFEKEGLVEMIARQGKGSLRDALSCLDRVLSYTKERVVREDDLVVALGLVRTGEVRAMVESLLSGKSGAVSESLRGMLQENVTVDNIILSVLDCVYEMIDDFDNFKQSFPKISLQEIYWIYENLVRDTQWARSSVLPEKSLEVVLKKIALRRQLLAPEKDKKSDDVAKIISEKVGAKAEPMPTPSSSSLQKKPWKEFIAHLEKISPVTASNLAQGNIISPILLESETLSVKMGFKHSSKVFYDHLNSKETRKKIIHYLGDFFKVQQERVNFDIEFLDRAHGSNFKSLLEVEREQKDQERSSQEKKLAESPIVKKALALFNAKVAKVQVFQE